jgi:hypothetical protein
MDHLELKKLGDFCSVIILSREAAREVEAHETQTHMGGAAHWSGRATRVRLALERRLISVFLWSPSSWKKTYALFSPYFW